MIELKLIPPTDPRVQTAIAPFTDDILKEHDESTLWVTKEDSHANNKAHLLISRFIKSKIFPNL